MNVKYTPQIQGDRPVAPTISDVFYWLATPYLEGIGPIRLRKWIDFFGNIKAIFSASSSELRLAGLSEKQVHAIKNIHWKIVEDDFNWCEKNNCQVLTWADDHYPKRLREIADAPPVLYVQGNSDLLHQPQLAMVGSRHSSAMGLENAEQFGFALAQSGLVITSGLALGVDAASHRGALAATGKTIAVMGTGLKQIYPRSNIKLAEEIKLTGAIISEFPPKAPAKASYFPLRNRVISGLSLGVLVVEAALKSGSLITARYANEQGREVFAMPGSIHDPLAKGCHYLIRQGAKLVESVEDILLELAALWDLGTSGLTSDKAPRVVVTQDIREDLDELHQQLLRQVGENPTALDTIVIQSGLTASAVSSMLLTLELKGYVSAVSGGYIRG